MVRFSIETDNVSVNTGYWMNVYLDVDMYWCLPTSSLNLKWSIYSQMQGYFVQVDFVAAVGLCLLPIVNTSPQDVIMLGMGPITHSEAFKSSRRSKVRPMNNDFYKFQNLLLCNSMALVILVILSAMGRGFLMLYANVID